MQKEEKNDMISTRFGTLWGQRIVRGEFLHRLHLKFMAWNERLERKIPEEEVEEDNEIYHRNISIRLTKWSPLLLMQEVMT